MLILRQGLNNQSASSPTVTGLRQQQTAVSVVGRFQLCCSGSFTSSQAGRFCYRCTQLTGSHCRSPLLSDKKVRKDLQEVVTAVLHAVMKLAAMGAGEEKATSKLVVRAAVCGMPVEGSGGGRSSKSSSSKYFTLPCSQHEVTDLLRTDHCCCC